MYKVSKEVHKKYGNVIKITRDDIGEYESPYPAFQQVKFLRRIWMEQGQTKVRVLIDQQILTIKQAEVWADEEYKSLPKCETCGKILDGNVFTHRLGGKNLFCTQICSDKDYAWQMEKLLDEEEIEYL